MSKRSPYEWDRVGEDKPNAAVIEVLKMLRESGYSILIFSGRDGSCRPQTEAWLAENGIFYTELLMRGEGDTRKDYLVKKELYESVKDKYNIIYVVDDRIQVASMWHGLGLCLLKVGDPEIRF